VDRYELRRQDYRLSEEHRALARSFRQFFETHCPIDAVYAAETSGFDKGLWERLCAMGAAAMALPESCGGEDATLVDLVLVAEEVGRSLAPVPWIDHVCASRLLARMGVLEGATGGALLRGEQIAAMDSQRQASDGSVVIASGAIADHIIVCDGESVIDLRFDTQPQKIDNIGRLPMARVDLTAADHHTVLASGPGAVIKYQLALDEWRLLSAAALVGLAEEAMTIAADFAKSRYTLGVPIATLQGISHPLANMAITIQGGRNLTRRAAWFLEYDPDERPELAPAAFVFMAEEAARIAMMASHIQGGLGVSAEAAAASYFLRAKGWPLAGGDVGSIAHYVAELVAARELRDRG
jgi:alkylation response protein AidB-like acyl-CoA dehydrogenase